MPRFHLVLGGAFALVRLPDETTYFVDRVEAIDPERDLAILKPFRNSPAYIPLADRLPKVGAPAFALGNPIGLRHTFSEGIVSAIRAADDALALLQTTAPISPGNSGGPLLDDRCRAIGVNTLQFIVGQNLNFAICAPTVNDWLARARSPQQIADMNGALPAANPGAASGKPPKWVHERDSLAGVQGVKVVVEHLDRDALAAGVTARAIQTAVELRPRQHGVQVLRDKEASRDPRSPFLYVNIGTIASPEYSTYGYVISVQLYQSVILVTPPAQSKLAMSAITWYAPSRYGSVGRLRLRQAVDESLTEMIDEFANDYLAANPNR